MKLRSWITTSSSLAIASLILVVSPANASGNAHSYGKSKAVYDFAHVLSVEPVIRYVTVRTPVKECWDEVRTYSTRHYQPGRAGKTLFGAILGGVIGHQFGSGHGNDAATIAGALVGAGIASNAAKNTPHYYTTHHERPIRRCQTNYQSHEEERVDGYRVIYAYHGQKYATRTPYDPGKRIRIRVNVRPAPF
jgi:uncharacterized protein YcfJ